MRFDPVECGKRIKSLREEKGLTQMELAEQLNVGLNHVKALERARRVFSLESDGRAFCDFFSVVRLPCFGKSVKAWLYTF